MIDDSPDLDSPKTDKIDKMMEMMEVEREMEDISNSNGEDTGERTRTVSVTNTL